MVLCTHPPVCVLFQREVVKHQPFQAIQNDCIPVFASAFPVRVENMWIKRLQVPMSPAFALTEYKVQGSTYRTAVLDLSRHSNARGEDAVHARHCSIYVQLSRLKTMSGLWLLEPVRLGDLLNGMHHELAAEDRRLQRLASATLRKETEAFTPVAGQGHVVAAVV